MCHRANLARALAKAGYQDVLVIDGESASKLFTDQWQELLHLLVNGDINSVPELAIELDRDVEQVGRDLEYLFKEDVIEYDTKSQRKIPQLKHKVVIAEPIVSRKD